MKIDRALPGGNARMEWGSDVAAEMLRRLQIRYVTHNPGSSFRGLHDSLVNLLGNADPTMLLCLNENQAVAIAHGYAKVTGEPMACILHANVGLLNGSMAIFNAWADRTPVYIIGAGGPADAEKRVPWINWLHTSRDQAAYVRGFTKWDDEPRSVGAMVEAMLRAHMLARTAPKGPVYVCLDAALQEERWPPESKLPDVARFRPSEPAAPSGAVIDRIADRLATAEKPVLLIGRVSRSEDDWRRRVQLAEWLGADVVTDLKTGAAFPTDHPLHREISYHFRSSAHVAQGADVILALDWIDLGSAMKMVRGLESKTIIGASIDSYLHNAVNMDCYGLSPVDEQVLVEPDILVRHLLPAVEKRLAGKARSQLGAALRSVHPPASDPTAAVTLEDLGWALHAARRTAPITLMRMPLGSAPQACHFTGPMDYLGNDGGAGVGSGPGNTVGGGLALLGSDRIAVGLIGDSDFIQGATAIWTAAHYRIPALLIVSNNRSHHNDELIQRRVARQRGRVEENSWIGQRIDEPFVNITKVAQGFGAETVGPVETLGDLEPAIARGLELVQAGHVCVVDVNVAPGSPARLAEYKPETGQRDRSEA